MKQDTFAKRLSEGRKIESTIAAIQPSSLGETGDELFSVVDLLKGTWTSKTQGWNLIALPFRDPSAQFNYRMLMNQYGETLNFNTANKNVPNRGITPDQNGNNDQLIDAISYEQVIVQVDAEDSPRSTLLEKNGAPIHHEPGFFAQILNHEELDSGSQLKIARLATVPHGDSVLAMGKVEFIDGAPIIPNLNALPKRISADLQNNPYLAPYKHFEDNPFVGSVPTTVQNFPGFFSTNANAILQFANPGARVKRTTILHFDTKFGTGGIVNIPFVTREANAAEMKATFWIMELESDDEISPSEFIMQYSQTVFLDFFPSGNASGELIRWPHVSINTLKKA